jgi:topoisomerase IA-like protein
MDPQSVTLEAALQLIAAKEEKGPGRAPARGRPKPRAGKAKEASPPKAAPKPKRAAKKS